MSSVNRAILSKAWHLRGKTSLIQTTGQSMQPLIKAGMWLVVQPCSYRDVKPGDVGLFYQNSGLVAHRVIFKEKQLNEAYLGHKGDNAYGIVTVSSSCLMGKVIQIRIPQDAINLERGYWRIFNRLLGIYLNDLWKIKYWLEIGRLSNGSCFYLPFAAVNQRILQFILRAGCWRKIDKVPIWSQLACNCITPQFASPADWPTEEINWNNFLETIRTQNIQGLGYAYLKQHRARVPGKVISNLAKSTHAVGYRNHKILAELSHLVKALKKAGVEVILLKGVAFLASQLYSNIAHRKMCDIDLLIKKQDLAKAEHTLKSLDYLPIEVCVINQEWCRQYSIKIDYFKSGCVGHRVEIHWGFEQYDNPFPITYEEFWHRAKKLSLNGIPVLVLCYEDMLLHHCMHAIFQHCLRIDLRCWEDIARLTRQTLDWPQLIASARQYQIDRVLYVALCLAHRFGDAQIPQEVLGTLRRKCSRRLIRWTGKQVNPLQLQKNCPVLETWLRLMLIKGLPRKARYLSSVLFPSRGEFSLLQNFDPLSRWSYLKNYITFFLHNVLGKTLTKYRLTCQGK